MTNKDTIDKLNRLEFFYWHKPTKTPEVLEQDKEQVKRDFALIRKDLVILEILKKHIKLKEVDGLFTQFKPYDIKMIILDEDDDFLEVKEWLENDK